MRVWSLQVKVTLAIVLSLLIIDAVGAGVAGANFRASETKSVQTEGATRVDAIENVLDFRFQTLAEAAKDTAQVVPLRIPTDLIQELRRAGFSTAIAVGPQGLLWSTGEASFNETLSALLSREIPITASTNTTFQEGWLVVAARSDDGSYAISGALDRDALSNGLLRDVLAEAGATNVVLSAQGAIIASSANVTHAEVMATQASIVASAPLATIPGAIISHRVPSSAVDARVASLSWKFVATSSAALIFAGAATILIIHTAMRPLREIIQGTLRMRAGEENLALPVRSRDELGILAQTLNESAAAIGAARREQEQHADQLRLAAEDFQIAVGALARSVGDADSVAEVSRRLGAAVTLVAPVNAVVVLDGDAPVWTQLTHEDRHVDLDDASTLALLSSDPEAFHWYAASADERAVRVAILPVTGSQQAEGTERKIGILLNQATLAYHRARGMESLRQARDELDHLVREKQMFVDILSHDLKNPLAVARGRAEMLAAKGGLELSQKVATITQSLDRATLIIEEAVLLSRLERDGVLERPITDVSALAAEASTSLAPLAATREIAIQREGPPVAWPANHLLVRAIENLLSNAIKWSPSGGVVTLVVEPAAEACHIKIIDHGPGIPPEDRPRLFARFERADRTGVKGTGLGLAIAKRVVEMHHGAIRIEDTPGGGSTFVIALAAPAKPEALARHEVAT